MYDLAGWIFIACLASALIALIELGITSDSWDEPVVYSPKLNYDNTEMNWFGCWFCFILIRLISPLFTIFALLMCLIFPIIEGIKWLFTVGRKDEDVN